MTTIKDVINSLVENIPCIASCLPPELQAKTAGPTQKKPGGAARASRKKSPDPPADERPVPKASPKPKPKSSQQKSTAPPKERRSLKAVFDEYKKFASSSTAPGMSSKQFAKLMRDCKLVDVEGLTEAAVDLAFTKAAAGQRGGKFIQYDQFEKALQYCAEAKGVSLEELHEKVMTSSGPDVSKGVRATANRFHDDKTSYTSTHRNGPPTNLGNR